MNRGSRRKILLVTTSDGQDFTIERRPFWISQLDVGQSVHMDFAKENYRMNEIRYNKRGIEKVRKSEKTMNNQIN